MSQGWENYTCLGRIGSDPDLKYPPKLGKPVVEFSLAVNLTWKDTAGKKQEETQWRKCKAFGKKAEVIAQFFKKGERILITAARLKEDTWVGSDGGKCRDMVVIVEDFKFIEKKA